MKIECKDEEQLKGLKERATKCKVIVLHKMGKHPLYDPRKLLTSERRQLLDKIQEWFEKDEQEINHIFNEISCEILFSGDADIQSYRRENPHCEDIDIKKDDPEFPSAEPPPPGGWKPHFDWKNPPKLDAPDSP